MNLFELTQDLLEQLQAPGVDTETGECDWDAYTKRLDELEGSFDEKALNVAKYIENLRAEAGAHKEAMARMKARMDAKNAHAERLAEYLLNMCKAADRWPEDSEVKIGKRKSSSVHIVDSNLLPETFVRVVTDRVPDKTAIRDAIKAGEIVPGASIEWKENLSIK